ncbi:MAG: 30S ribosomal protein S6 [Candidatus Omnitrophica bacterium]|nr:30S ribosomal protein S6 [Candidatus Omnitrophota bacterium]
MGRYEGLFIVKSDLAQEEQKAVFAQIEEPITKQGGTLETAQEWGRRPLAYTIRKKKEGMYYLVRFQLEPSGISVIKRNYSLNESILGSLITCLKE